MKSAAGPAGSGFPEAVTHVRVDRRNVNNGRAALAAVFTALVACTLLAATHSGASPTALTGWLATGKAGEPKFYEPPADAAAQGAESGLNSDPFHSNGANYGTGTAAAPLDGKNLDESVPRYLMQPKWAAREGREAAAHSLAQPFLVPLEANGMPVAGAEVTPLGEYAPTTPQYTNPLAQFIPNVTYVEDGNEVVGFEGPEDAAEEDVAEEDAGEEPVTSEEKELNLMKSALRSVEVNKGSVKDLVARLETAQAKEEAVSGAMQRRPQAMAKLRNDLKQEDALLREHSNAALRIRQRIAQLGGSNMQSLQTEKGAAQPEIRPRMMNPGQYTNGMQNTISPIYGAPPEVTAGAVQAMKQADLINQVQVTYK